jgi:putative Holliday junction resolvase
VRTLAIDLGTKRVGLALSDEGGRYATPLDVVAAGHAVAVILDLVRKEHVARLVVGLPLNMDGSLGPAAHSAIAWGNALAAQAKLPVHFIDERLSSFDAEQQLTQRKRAGEKLTRQRKKRQLDAVAAAGFLQDFLDGKLKPIEL